MQQSTYLREPICGIRWWLQLLLFHLLQKGGELTIRFLELCIKKPESKIERLRAERVSRQKAIRGDEAWMIGYDGEDGFLGGNGGTRLAFIMKADWGGDNNDKAMSSIKNETNTSVNYFYSIVKTGSTNLVHGSCRVIA